MMELLHKVLIWIHIPFGTLSLILFWIPVGVKKGGNIHRKVGWYYYYCMWGVLITAALLSITNTIMGNYMAAIFLGYLTIITSFPLWYSLEILRQPDGWTDRYFMIRKIFLAVMSLTGIVLALIGFIVFKFQNMGTVMVFFGILGINTVRELVLTREQALKKETRLKMHIQGTIITGIAAYTAFFAFGGQRILMNVLHLDAQWMVVPWTLPTLLGFAYSRYMKRKYKVA